MNQKSLLMIPVAVLICAFALAQVPVQSASRLAPTNADELSATLPLDTTITKGRLHNGITYYIRANQKPEKRAELRLVVNAGSMLEDDNQQGLAHFVEHMAFNGTKNFPKQDIVNFLESVGVRFGADLNAYTSFDETVYMLQVPTDTPSIMNKAFDILEDWAHLVSFDDQEIDKERGVIIEEWRLGRGAEARIRDKQFPVVFKNSRYAVRLPIGKKKILETFKHDTLRRFYKDWYRPDLMAVVAVGDFDTKQIEALIKKHFSAVPKRTAERKRTLYPVPGNPKTLFAIATDPEESTTEVSLNFKHDVESDTLVRDYRRGIIERLYSEMLTNRLTELSRQVDPPFMYAYSFDGRFVRTKEFYSLTTVVREGGVQKGFAAMLTEAQRVRTYGFTATELERQKQDMLRSMQAAYEERDKTESASFAAEYIRNFLVHEPSPGIAREYEMYKKFLPGITVDEINHIADHWITDQNRVVMLSAPEKAGSTLPTAATLSALIDSVGKASVTPYVDKLSSEPLVPNVPLPGTIVERKEWKELGATELKLSNGVRVILKPTDFKNDEVLFSSFSWGGTSLVPDSDYISAITATSVVQEGGLGSFDRISLEKKLAGKLANAAPSISELAEGVSGSASPRDLTTMFQLIYLYFTAPRQDSVAFLSYLAKMRGALENRNARPEAAFEDTMLVTMAQHNPRRRPFTVPTLDEMNLKKSFAFYRERFADASDFTFIFVGTFAEKEVEPLILTYLGTLPSLGRHDKWRDVGIRPPEGVITKTVMRGIEPKAQVRIVFSGPFTWSRENRHAIVALASVLRIKLREALREEKGGTYGVSVSGSPIHYPRNEYRFNVAFGCAPERVDELVKTAFEQIDSLKNFGVSETYITKVKETEWREREVSLKQNGFWLSALEFCLSNDIDPKQILTYNELVATLNSDVIRNASRTYLNTQGYAKFILLPSQGAPQH
jgi:zinc protease